MDYLRVSDVGSAPLHATDRQSVSVDYAHVALARNKALQAFTRVEPPTGSDAERIAHLESGVQELSDAVLALVGVLTELVSGLDQRDVHVVGYPNEEALTGKRPG